MYAECLNKYMFCSVLSLQKSIEHVSIVYTCNPYCNALVHVMYSEVSVHYSYTILAAIYLHCFLTEVDLEC